MEIIPWDLEVHTLECERTGGGVARAAVAHERPPVARDACPRVCRRDATRPRDERCRAPSARDGVATRARGARFESASPVEGPCEACRLSLVFARKVESGLVGKS